MSGTPEGRTIEQGINLGVEKKKRKGEGEDEQMIESKKSKTGEDWDKPISASGSRDDSDSLASLREQKATLQDRKQTLHRENEALIKGIRDAIDNSPAFAREIHDCAAEIEGSKLVGMYHEKLATLSARLAVAPSKSSQAIAGLRKETGGQYFGHIHDQMIKDRVEELQKKLQKEMDEKETEKAVDAGAAPGSVFPRLRSVIPRSSRGVPTVKLRPRRAMDKHQDGEMK